MSYSVRAERQRGGSVVEVSGDIDAAAAEALDTTLASVIDGAGAGEFVVVDLAGANFLDSRSIGILADWQTRLRSHGGRMALAGARAEVIRLFELIGMREAFAFFPGIAEARSAEA